ncbi:MAG: GrpE protein [Actinoallomurus sp.]|nr:GrpE protein [Actinoallomurus sp.]
MSDMRPDDETGRPGQPVSPPDENAGRPEEPVSRPGPETGGPGPETGGPGGDTGRPEAETARPEADPAAKIAELEDRWRRALADLDNFRKRAARDAERQRAGERARTSAEWLPVLDNLERALEHAEADPRVVIQGVRSVLDQAMEVINRLGFPRREDEGQLFDPTRHEAVSTDAASDAPDGTIVQVVRPGYGDGETQLRPAQVVVAKGRGNGPVP